MNLCAAVFTGSFIHHTDRYYVMRCFNDVRGCKWDVTFTKVGGVAFVFVCVSFHTVFSIHCTIHFIVGQWVKVNRIVE